MPKCLILVSGKDYYFLKIKRNMEKSTLHFRSVIMLLIFLAGLISFAVNAQNKTGIQGVVRDKISGEPVSNAAVTLTPGNKGTVTGKNGNFAFLNLNPGKYGITVSFVGYTTLSKTFNVVGDNILEIELFLEPEERMLEPVVIQEKIIDKIPYIRNEVVAVEMQQTISRDAGEYLRNVPNVSSIRKGGTNLDPVVRGFRFSQLNVQVNRGMKIEGGCPNRMDPATSHVEMDDIDEIEVIKGPYALRYGPSVGGVINLITARPTEHQTFDIHVKAIKGFESNWNGQKEHLAISGGNQKAFFLFSGNNKEYGDYKAGNGEVINSDFRKYDYKGQVGAKPFRNHLILFSWDEIRGRNVKYPALSMDERTDDTRLLSLDYEIKELSKSIKSVTLKLYNSILTLIV